MASSQRLTISFRSSIRKLPRQLETSGIGVLAGVEGCLLWQPAINTAARRVRPKSPEGSVAVARGVFGALDGAFGDGCGVCKGGSGGWLGVSAEQITKELATVGEIAGVLDNGFRNHHRGMLRGCFEHAAALPFDHGVGGFPAHLVPMLSIENLV